MKPISASWNAAGLCLSVALLPVPVAAQTISTVAGNTSGFNRPDGLAIDAGGNIFVADILSGRVRRISGGVVTSYAGGGNSSADSVSSASLLLGNPSGVAANAAGDVFVTDYYGNRVWRISGGVATRFAGNGAGLSQGDGGLATQASIMAPENIAVDTAGNVYVAGDRRVRRISAATGIISTVAGGPAFGQFADGVLATSAYLPGPQGMAIDAAGNLFIADTGSARVRRVDAVTKIITTYAGNGSGGSNPVNNVPATSAALDTPWALAFDSAGNLYIAEYSGNRVRRVNAATKLISHVAGNGIGGDGGPAATALLQGPRGLAIDSGGNLILVETDANRVRRIAALDPNRDSDGDGIPNAVEALEGRNAEAKDNDIFGNARLFAMQQYRDFLAREGDSGGVSFWADQVATGAQSHGQAIESFFSSAEFQGTIAPVARLYFAYFQRIPDYAGLNFWIGYYKGGNPLASVSQNFATSQEFTARYGALDNGQFVDLVYQNVLGRPADAGGKAFWKGQLDTGAMNRGEVMLGFSESDEYKLAIASEVYVTMVYNGMLRRAPDAGGFAFWVQYRDAGNSGLALIELFLGTPEYRARFLP